MQIMASSVAGAIAQYRRALKLQPGNTTVALNLSLAFYKPGQTEAAADTLIVFHPQSFRAFASPLSSAD